MKDSQQNLARDNYATKYIKVNNERFSTVDWHREIVD